MAVKKVLVALPREMHSRLLGLAAAEQTSVTDIIREAIAEFVGLPRPPRSRRRSPFDARHSKTTATDK